MQQRLRLLKRINTLVREARDVQRVLDEVVVLIREEIAVDATTVFIREEDDTLSLRATMGLNTAMSNQFRISRLDQSIIGTAIAKGKVVALYGAHTNPRWKSVEGLGEELYRSVLAVPLVDRGQAIGVIILHSKQSRTWSSQDTILLTALANQVATIINNALLLERLRGVQTPSPPPAPEASASPEDSQPAPEPSKTSTLAGDAASPGAAYGRALIAESSLSLSRVTAQTISDPEKQAEMARLEAAVQKSRQQLTLIQQSMAAQISLEHASVFNAHLMIMEDPGFKDRISAGIADGYNAEYAVRLATQYFIDMFSQFDDPYFRDRAVDMLDIGMRVIQNLMGLDEPGDIEHGVVVVTEELTPSQAVYLSAQDVRGIVVARGGLTSHGVILAKSMGIPAVVGVKNLLDKVHMSDRLLVDGNEGSIHINPDDETIDAVLHHATNKPSSVEVLAESLRSLPMQTLDGVNLELMANVGMLTDTHHLEQYGAQGIGLYRTEFPFMARNHFPSEAEQLDMYQRVIERAPDRRVVIRTLDAGGDKMIPFMDLGHEENPSLGFRSIRVSLNMVDQFKIQLRAILRAAVHGEVSVMFPMISGLDELRQVLSVLRRAKRELRRAGVPFVEDIPVGIMVELPSAVLTLEDMISEIDFVSIGTNDLVQYTLAVDRNNERVAQHYEPMHPAVLKLIAETAAVTKAASKRLSICGEMASDPTAAAILLGMGIRSFSMNAVRVPILKSFFRQANAELAEMLAQQVLKLRSVKDVHRTVRDWFNRHNLDRYLKATFPETLSETTPLLALHADAVATAK